MWVEIAILQLEFPWHGGVTGTQTDSAVSQANNTKREIKVSLKNGWSQLAVLMNLFFKLLLPKHVCILEPPGELYKYWCLDGCWSDVLIKLVGGAWAWRCYKLHRRFQWAVKFEAKLSLGRMQWSKKWQWLLSRFLGELCQWFWGLPSKLRDMWKWQNN